MAYKQVKAFNLANMGTEAGWCLRNVANGFSIATKMFPSAKADMEYQRAHGTLHDISTIPTGVAVPVYCDTTSVYEHVIVRDKDGKCYSDGKLVNLNQFKAFGWAECCSGERVVEYVADAPSINDKSVEELAKEVISGKYGNGEARKQALGARYAEVQARVNGIIGGNRPAGIVYHKVVAGDTLSALAVKYGTTVNQLVAWNHIQNPNLIVVGWTLRVK